MIHHAAGITVADTNDRQAAVQAAKALVSRHRIDGVLTTCDYYLETVATIARSLGLPGPSPEVMHLNSGTSVRRVDDDAALKDAFWDITGHERNTRGQPTERLLLVEKLLAGREVSVEAVTVDGATTVIGITDKTVLSTSTFVEAGHLFPAPLDPAAARAAETITVQALDAIGYDYGLSHTEIKLTADGVRIVEINPRQAGGHIFDLVHLVTGTHLLQVLVDLALGQTPQVGTPARPLATMRAPAASAAVSFVMSPQDGTLRAIEGTDALDADPHVHQWEIRTSGHAEIPQDNNARLGHVLAVDPLGHNARDHADAAVQALVVRLDRTPLRSAEKADHRSAPPANL